MADKLRIACPKCSWEPKPTDMWRCSCDHVWHTFDTYGRCPVCNKQWRETMCHHPRKGGCGQWSPHIDWYRDLEEWLREEIERAFRTAEVEVGV